MVHEGRKVLDDDLAAIRRAYDPRTVELEPLNADADLSRLAAMPEVEHVRPADRAQEVRLRRGTDPAEAMRRILDAVPAARIEIFRPRLEDVFVDLVGAAPTGLDEEPDAGAPPEPGRTGGTT